MKSANDLISENRKQLKFLGMIIIIRCRWSITSCVSSSLDLLPSSETVSSSHLLLSRFLLPPTILLLLVHRLCLEPTERPTSERGKRGQREKKAPAIVNPGPRPSVHPPHTHKPLCKAVKWSLQPTHKHTRNSLCPPIIMPSSHLTPTSCTLPLIPFQMQFPRRFCPFSAQISRLNLVFLPPPVRWFFSSFPSIPQVSPSVVFVVKSHIPRRCSSLRLFSRLFFLVESSCSVGWNRSSLFQICEKVENPWPEWIFHYPHFLL